MNTSLSTASLTLPRLSLWSIGYALRHWQALLGVVLSIVLNAILDLLKPWPMVFLVNHALQGKPMSPLLAEWGNWLPGTSTPMNLVNWSVAATFVLFILSWGVGIFGTYAAITLGLRIDYDIAGEVFEKLQHLSL